MVNIFVLLFLFFLNASFQAIHACAIEQNIVLEYDQKAKYNIVSVGDMMNIVAVNLPFIPMVLCCTIAEYVEEKFVQTAQMKDPDWFYPSKYFCVTFVSGDIIAAGSRAGCIELWNIKTKKRIVAPYVGCAPTSVVTCESQSQIIVAGSKKGDVTSLRCVQESSLKLNNWNSYISECLIEGRSSSTAGYISSLIHLDQSMLVIGNGLKPVSVYNFSTQKKILINSLQRATNLVKITSDSFAAIANCKLYLMDIRMSQPSILETSRDSGDMVSIDENTLAISGRQTIDIFDIHKRMQRTNIITGAQFTSNLAPYGRHLVFDVKRNIKLWDVEKNQCLENIPLKRCVIALAMHKQSSSLIAATYNHMDGPDLLLTWHRGANCSVKYSDSYLTKFRKFFSRNAKSY